MVYMDKLTILITHTMQLFNPHKTQAFQHKRKVNVSIEICLTKPVVVSLYFTRKS